MTTTVLPGGQVIQDVSPQLNEISERQAGSVFGGSADIIMDVTISENPSSKTRLCNDDGEEFESEHPRRSHVGLGHKAECNTVQGDSQTGARAS